MYFNSSDFISARCRFESYIAEVKSESLIAEISGPDSHTSTLGLNVTHFCGVSILRVSFPGGDYWGSRLAVECSERQVVTTTPVTTRIYS